MIEPNIGKKILIIEDEESFLSILQKVFSSEGFLVLTAKDGEGGISVAEKEKPDLIISDILMPRMDGLTMAKRIRDLKIFSPIIFLTNIGEQERDNKEFEYLTKSEMNINEIVAKVKEKLDIK
jgi:DNA-binding response OmpR family regulator